MSCLSGLAAAILFTMPKGSYRICVSYSQMMLSNTRFGRFPPSTGFTLPSRYCQSDLLTRMARESVNSVRWRASPNARRLVRQHVEYHYGTTDAKTSAFDTATEQIGVCRDFAHLVIAFCRALGIPARYASCYAPGLEPPDLHSVAQVYLSGAWHNVDATTDAVRPALIPIARSVGTPPMWR